MSGSKKSPFARKKAVDPRGKKKTTKTRSTAQEKLNCLVAYLNGMDSERLCIIGNTTPMTLEKWKSEWNHERNKAMMVLRASELEINVTAKEIEEHQDYIANLRTLKTSQEQEIQSLEEVSKTVRVLLEQLKEHPDFDQKDFKQIVALMKIYADSKILRSSLQTDYIKLNTALNTETGITAYHKAAANAVNEAEKARARMKVAEERREKGLETSTELRKGGGFFEA